MKPFLAIVILLLLCLAGCEQKDFYSSKEDDEQEMSTLRREIDKLTEQVSCEQASDWKFVPIGSKPCGGATGYVAYAAKIDEPLFLKKVAIYTQKQKAFNVKWSLASDCAIQSPPKSIECVNGKPKFVY